MTLDQQEISRKLQCYQIAKDVSMLERGRFRNRAVRVKTAFKYPDGSNIDLYIYEVDNGFQISDFGETFTWLSHLLIDPTKTQKRKQYLEDTLKFHNVILNGSMIERTCSDMDKLQSFSLEVGLACVKLAELHLSKRNLLRSTFNEDVEEVISDLEFDYDQNFDAPGRHGPVKVDFLVKPPNAQKSAILTLSAGVANHHNICTDIFTKWYDIGNFDAKKITLIDDSISRQAYKKSDLDRLLQNSILIDFSDRERLHDTLVA